MSAPTWQVGQTVYVRDRGRGMGRLNVGEVIVSKVGRKYVYVKRWGRDIPFYIDTGGIADNYGGSRIMTAEMVQQERREDEARQRLQGLGIRFDYRSRVLTVEQMNAFAELLADG